MGADNISIITVYPSEISAEALAAVRSYLADVRKFCTACDDNAELVEKLFAAYSAADAGATIGAVKELLGVAGVTSTPGLVNRIVQAFWSCQQSCDDIGYPDDLDAAPPWGTGFRDSAERLVKIAGKEWIIVSAGASSWGDEPSGGGYVASKMAHRWGVVEMVGGQ